MKKPIDYNALDRVGWEDAGKTLADAPTKTWINIGQGLNAGDRFFKGDKGVDEKMLIRDAGAVIKTLDERSLRDYREVERKTRAARGKMAENGSPLDRGFIFCKHIKELKSVDDQVLFLVEKRGWKNHNMFRDAVEMFSEAIAEKPDADHNVVFDETFTALEQARQAAAAVPRSKPDKNKVKVMLRLPKETHAVIEWYYGITENKTVEQALADAAYELAQEHESEYQDEKRRIKAADEHAAGIQKLTKAIAAGEVLLGKLQGEKTTHQAEITLLKDRPPTTDAGGYELNVDNAIFNHSANITHINKQIEKTEAALALVRDKLAAAQATSVTPVTPSTEAECQPSA